MNAQPPACLIVYTTFPSREEASRIGRILLEEQLAACINIFDKVLSLYHWEGALQEDEEFSAFIKTNIKISEKLVTRLKELHPYDVPAILCLKPASTDQDYEAWIEKQLSKTP